MRYSAILAAALSAAVLATPAAANTSTVGVKYADLNLTTEAGQAALDARIDRAAREVCGVDDIRTGTRAPSASARQCYKETKSNVHKQVAERIVRENNRG